jgi:hypothetical protein
LIENQRKNVKSNLAEILVSELTEEEKKKVQSWAEKAIVIRNDSVLTTKDKIEAFYKITNDDSVIKTFVMTFMKLIKKHGWTERSLKGKLTIGAATLGLATMGSSQLGIATAGWGLSMPFFLLSAMGGAFLGTLIEEINKKIK